MHLPYVSTFFLLEKERGLRRGLNRVCFLHQSLCVLLPLLTALVWTVLLLGLPQSLPGAD